MPIETEKGPGGVDASYGARFAVTRFNRNDTYDDRIYLGSNGVLINSSGQPISGGETWIDAQKYGADPTGNVPCSDLINVLLTGGPVYLGEGTFLLDKAIRFNGHKLYGAGWQKTKLTRSNITSEIINGSSVISYLYLASRGNEIQGFTIESDISSGPDSMDGLYFGDFPDFFSNSSIHNLRIVGVREAFVDAHDLYMVDFQNINLTSCANGFKFRRTSFKTSCTFSSCWAENCGTPFYFNRFTYSSATACGADFGNWEVVNAYGRGFGYRSTSDGIFTIENSDMTLNACGAENSYGNGVFLSVAARLVLNNPFGYACKSRFNPDFTSYPSYGLGPIMTSQEYTTITINTPRFESWENEYLTESHPEIQPAALVGFNYNEGAYGVREYCMVFLGPHFIPASSSIPIIKGLGNVNRYTRDIYRLYTDPRVEGTQSLGTYRKHFTSRQITGVGNTISIPVISQSNWNTKVLLEYQGIDGTYNSPWPLAFGGKVALSSLTTINGSSVTLVDQYGLTATASSSGLNLHIKFSAPLENPIISFNALVERNGYILPDSVTLIDT